MPIDESRARKLLRDFNFPGLFVEELGWDKHKATLSIPIDNRTFELSAVAEKRGMAAFICECDGALPDYNLRRKVERQVAKSAHEHFIVFTDPAKTRQVWQWVKREPGKPAAAREHHFDRNQSGEALIQKLKSIAFELAEEGNLTLVDVTIRARAGFDVEKVTKRFYERFQKEHGVFLKFIKGIPDDQLQRWYASVMLNRLMFIYFIQKKGFLSGDINYLRNKLTASKPKDRYFSHFLCPLFFEGFAKKSDERSAATNQLLGEVPYLNGGLFLRHQIEELHGKSIQMPDTAFERIFDFFEAYQWHLDERPLRADNEINPDVLGYIFEKYINQKQMGAYYTKEDITEYIAKNTVLPFLFDAARPKCKIAFENPKGPTIWDLLRANPDRYIYAAVEKGVDIPLPKEIAAGIKDVSKRDGWNKPARAELALPAETWREVVARRQRYEELRKQLASGEVCDINQLITLNIDIRQLAQDVIENCEGPELLRAFWHAIESVTVLDPACGSGAFLFAALNILEPLYEACLDRMEAFVRDIEHSPEGHRPEKFKDFRDSLKRMATHPNRRYFVFKSIILNNLFGVDIMEEATEICKLRLFLKLVAQIDRIDQIEPLPDIDFNIRGGNSLVGYATYEEVKTAIAGQLDFENALAKIEDKALTLQSAFEMFRLQQTELGGTVTAKDKENLRERLRELENELNRYLAADYGRDYRKAAEFQKWLDSHKPFHWLIEFYSIIKNGGFDVIIGNPPYVEYSKVRAEYRVQPIYTTLPCGNLYTLFLERCYGLTRKNGWLSLIMPLSLVCTSRTEEVRELVRKCPVWISTYDMRPSSLFEGVAQRLSILVAQNQRNGADKLLVGGYRRWCAEERPFLIQQIRYAPLPFPKTTGPFPKFSVPTESSILGRITGKPLAQFSSETSQAIFVHRIVRYFAKALNFLPLFVDARGKRGKSEDYKEFRFASDEKNQITALLNSTLFYWFWRSHCDGFHCGYNDVYSMPYKQVTDSSCRQSLEKLLVNLMRDLQEKSQKREITTKAGQIRYQEFYASESKPILDKIDRVLAQHYGFTAEELDFIINYDIKYRMGLGGEDAEEE